MSDRLSAELDSFQSIRHGGYFDGDPLDPMTQSGFTQLGYMSALHVVYLACIKPYVDPYRLPSSWRARTVVAGLRSALTATWRPPRHQRHISR